MRARVWFAPMAAVFCGASPPPGTSPAPQASAAQDPSDEVVCEKIIVTGSRLGAKRICTTRKRWGERKLDDRQMIDNLQTRLCVYSHNGAGGRPAC